MVVQMVVSIARAAAAVITVLIGFMVVRQICRSLRNAKVRSEGCTQAVTTCHLVLQASYMGDNRVGCSHSARRSLGAEVETAQKQQPVAGPLLQLQVSSAGNHCTTPCAECLCVPLSRVSCMCTLMVAPAKLVKERHLSASW